MLMVVRAGLTNNIMSVKSPLIRTQSVTALPCHRVSRNYGYSSGHDIIGNW
ncbi:hypothetical protein [Microseira sp. BLCC-F43]|uniref:hypothetical protein n=1 Tax=Microseira sp. BLCC-F43 TaxID=3153602 RepID=UPI0035B72D93